MEHTAGIGHGRDLVVNDDVVGLADFEWPERSTRLAGPPNSHYIPVRTELMYRISPDLLEGEPPDQYPSAAAAIYCDQLERDERVQARTCPFVAGRVVRHTHLQRVAFGLLVDGSGGVLC